ncbi:MAG: hypothetical protein GXP15_02735 [Gammaproteobacteria bacterium]|nr:hypothetical protein [Gammaproteobacteria bacterium]
MKKVLTLVISLAASVSAYGHHSFSAEFDANKFIAVTGTVTEVRFRNPHIQYFLDVDTDGQTNQWVVAGQNVIVMRRSGVSARTISIGDSITVNGYAGRDGAHRVYLDSMQTAAGKLYSMYGDAARRKVNVAATELVSDPTSPLIEKLLGDWAFDVDKPLPGAPLHLQFERDGDNVRAIFDDEVIDVAVGEDSFVMVLSRENRAGFPAKLELTGRLVDGEIEGVFNMIAGYSNFAELDAKTFSAVRTTPDVWQAKPPAPMAPVDLTGIWKRSIVLGPIGRTNPQLTEAGTARHREYQKGAYDPILRCIEVGPMRRQARRGDIEIMATTNRLTVLYANDNGIRRFWFDRKEHSTERDHDIMGESLASWDGSTLVIDTRNLSEAVLTHNAEPISADARILERYWLNDDGDLVMVATLHDPKYYQRPITKRLLWTRSDDTDLLYSPCDPDAFYRGLHFDGVLDDYFNNQPSDE